jgi:hypothetical protein
MKIQIYLLCVLAMLLSVNVDAQKQQIKHDPFPDEEVIAALEKLALASPADLDNAKLLVSTKDGDIHLGSYLVGRNLVSANGFGGQRFLEIKKVIGFSASQKKVLDWIAGMQKQAVFLDHVRFNEPGEPTQSRIAYSWGSKEYIERTKPPGVGDCCTYAIHGLDCSGFIYQLLKLNNILIPSEVAYADQERRPEFLKKYLKKYFFGAIPFDVVDVKKIKVKDMQSGDIIYFKDHKGLAFHIGIILVNDSGETAFYQSLGSPNRKKDDFKKCQSNLDNRHGILSSKLDASIEDRDYACIRVIPR